MNREESLARCRGLFLAEKAAGRAFYAVNRPYNALLRLPTADEFTHGIETQESTERARVKSTHIIIVRADINWNPVLIQASDGRLITDQWSSGLEKVRNNFEFTSEPYDEHVVRAIRKRGRPCAYVRLSEMLETLHDRGSETWTAGSYMSCWDEEALNDFTAVTPISFAEMKEPADPESAKIFETLCRQ